MCLCPQDATSFFALAKTSFDRVRSTSFCGLPQTSFNALLTQNEVACGKRCYAVGINDVLLRHNDVTAFAVNVLRFAQIYSIIPVDEVIL